MRLAWDALPVQEVLEGDGCSMSAFSCWCSQFRVDAFDVDGDGGEDVLDVGLGLAAVAGLSHAVAVDELVDGALDAGAHCVVGLPGSGLLGGSGGSLTFVKLLRQKVQLASVAAGAARLDRAWAAVLLGEPDPDIGGDRQRRRPFPARLALWADDLLSFPVDGESVTVKYLPLA
jgi:hypothetical protein